MLYLHNSLTYRGNIFLVKLPLINEPLLLHAITEKQHFVYDVAHSRWTDRLPNSVLLGDVNWLTCMPLLCSYFGGKLVSILR